MVFVFDLDGTLLDDEERLSPENKEAVLKVAEEHTVILASGRMLRSILKFSRESFDMEFPTIAYNGSMVYVPGRGVIWNESIPPSTASDLIRRLRELKVHRQAYVNDELVAEEDNELVKAYARHSRVDYRIVEDLVELVSVYGSTKVLAIGEPEVLDEISERLKPEFPRLEIFKSFPTYLDFVKSGINKARALEVLADHLGFDLRDVVAFGDNDNDAPLLEVAGFGVAMGNATPRTKEVADVVAPSNNDSGVARVVFDILSGDLEIGF